MSQRFGSVCVFLLFLCILLPPAGGMGQERITLAMTEWPPFTGEDMPHGGYLAHLTVAALELEGFQVELVSLPWKRALEATMEGGYCGLIGAAHTEERSMSLLYPEENWQENHILLAHPPFPRSFDTLDDLCPATLGVLNGSYLLEALEDSCLELDTSPSVELNVMKFLYGRVDFVIDTRPSLEHFLTVLAAPGENQALFIEAGLPPDTIYTVFSRACPQGERAARAFDNGMRLLRESGRHDEILRLHGMLPD